MIGRAIFRWENERILNDPGFWSKAQAIAQELHAYDPDIIFQGCLFEAISEDVNTIPIPEWVFQSYGMKPEKRNFSYKDMLSKEGKYVDHWHKGGSVPDISRTETQLWFLFWPVLISTSVAMLSIWGRSNSSVCTIPSGNIGRR